MTNLHDILIGAPSEDVVIAGVYFTRIRDSFRLPSLLDSGMESWGLEIRSLGSEIGDRGLWFRN